MSDEQDTNFDRAVASRLSRLRAVPVELGSLEARVRAQTAAAPSRSNFGWGVPLRAMAAGIAGIAVTVGVLLALLGRPHAVSASELAQLHAQVLSGESHAMAVNTVGDAARALRSNWDQAPVVTGVGLPIKSCCVHAIDGKKVACMSVVLRGEPVTVAIGRTSDLRVTNWPTTTHDGMTCRCYAAPGGDGLNAVAMERNGMLILMIGKQPTNELLNAINEVRL